ncbi:MAG TPA: folylpolyglutamate synthase/dihydrofolate synthase family protein [Candidatus Baltobacteraceae bacterium]|nr:folylpolyglutamate synthase/dihydrofolate synthase family protein [Candidatus Baltobacteraceae bacterium]
MEFGSAQEYLLATINETVSRRMPYRLERMRAFMRELGDPQDRYPTVHVGGTSGKGSTSMMIAAALGRSGKRVGLHTKPHLRSMTERARIDGVAIGEERFGALLEEMMPAIERTTRVHGRPTYYETLLGLTLLYFAQEQVDVAVIEVGLGGRLDGTNVIVPVVAAITSVGLDHTDVLGDSIEEIALEKAGIAKPGVPIVVAADDEAAYAVIAQRAKETGAPLVDARSSAIAIEDSRIERDGQAFTVRTARARYAIETRMLGVFQRRNAATAIVTMEALPDGLRPSVEQVEAAFAELTIPGRMEVYPGHPSLVFDIAHNVEKAEQLLQSLRERFADRHFTFVVAIGASKDATEILRTLAALPANFVFTTFETAGREATSPMRLLRIAESLGTWGRAVADPVEALSVARRSAAANDVIVVTGSTFLVAALREWWLVAA